MVLSIVVTGLLLLGALPTQAQDATGFSLGAKELDPLDPPLMTANATGTYTVGVRRDSFSFDDRQLNVSWWYPATASSGSSAYISSGGIYGQALEDAPVDSSGGPYPLIVFSPGLGAHDDTYFFYCQNLASSGYIVISINHLDSTEAAVTNNPLAIAKAAEYVLEDNSSYSVWLLYSDWFRSTHFALTYRPQEIGFILDQAIAAGSDSSSPFNGVMDTENIGLTGHSLGGFYSLIKGSGFPIYCDYDLTPAESNPANPILTEVSICVWPEAQSLTSPTALHDSRIKAVISLAPPFFIKPSEIPRSAEAITTPTMILTGNDPKFESTLEPQRQTYDGASGPKYKVEIDTTNHLLVSEAYEFNSGSNATVPAADSEDFEEKAEVYMEYSAAFFNVYLKGATSDKSTLHTETSSFVASLEYSD
jgi:predicted dienelactone hydrolase